MTEVPQATARVEAVEVMAEGLTNESRVKCGRCGQFFDTIYRGRVPGHTMGSNWDWVPCPDCDDGFVTVPPLLKWNDEPGDRIASEEKA